MSDNDVWRWIQISTSAFSLIGVSAIAITSITKPVMKGKTGKPVDRKLIILFYVAVISAILNLISGILNSVAWLGHDDEDGVDANDPLKVYSLYAERGFYVVFFQCLLCTLIVRLWVVFEGSAFRMSNCMKNTFVVLCAVLVLDVVINYLMFIILQPELKNSFEVADPDIAAILLTLTGTWLLTYAVASGMAVWLFVRNLLKLVRNIVEPRADGALNEQEQKMMRRSNKYLSLFLVALGSTFVSLIPGFVGADLTHSFILFPIDIFINLICLYLQFWFVESSYDRFCGKVDKSTRKVIESYVNSKSRNSEQSRTTTETEAVSGQQETVVSDSEAQSP